jgi:DNA repair protein RecO (recombination protein O)
VPVYQSEALILRTYKLGEADMIVVFLTRDRGKKRGVAKGARRARSRYTGALEPMTRAGVAYYEREQRDLVRLNYVEATRSPLSAMSGDGLGYVGYFAELIDEWAPEAHADERLYRLGSAVLDAMTGGAPVEPLARYFEYWLLRLQGVYPSIRHCPGCGAGLGDGAAMPAQDAVLLCRGCAPGLAGTRLSPEAMLFLTNATAVAPDLLTTLTLGPHAARELETAHRRLIAVHLDKDLKSARVLREMRQVR